MTIYGRSEELVSRCVECDLAEPESLTSLGGSAHGVVDGILSHHCLWDAHLVPIMEESRRLWGCKYHCGVVHSNSLSMGLINC